MFLRGTYMRTYYLFKRRATGWTAEEAGLNSRQGESNVCLLHSTQTGYVANQISYPMGTVRSFSGGKTAGA
jgi:hypothetical protein